MDATECYDHAPVHHCRGLQCPECYRFSAHSWRQEMSTQNGWNELYGGICREHGPWTDSAA